MPAIAQYLQKRFKLTIEDGLPQAVIETNADGDWLRCCPLCGCIHHLLDEVVDETQPYTPSCQTIPLLYQAQQAKWRKLYPDVVQYKSLHLVRAG